MTDSLTLFRQSYREAHPKKETHLPKTTGGPSFRYEDETGLDLVCGIDEAGRGPLAGPVVAAAVVLDRDNVPEGINDSKKLTEAKRDALFDAIQEAAQVGVGIAEVHEIDELNILQATLLAMARAFEALPSPARFALIDGIHAPKIACPTATLTKGDSKSLSIGAASIIAKVTRDRLMYVLHTDYPEFGWAQNKGYGSAAHLAELRASGPTPHHRRSFEPVKSMVSE